MSYWSRDLLCRVVCGHEIGRPWGAMQADFPGTFAAEIDADVTVTVNVLNASRRQSMGHITSSHNATPHSSSSSFAATPSSLWGNAVNAASISHLSHTTRLLTVLGRGMRPSATIWSNSEEDTSIYDAAISRASPRFSGGRARWSDDGEDGDCGWDDLRRRLDGN